MNHAINLSNLSNLNPSQLEHFKESVETFFSENLNPTAEEFKELINSILDYLNSEKGLEELGD